MSATVILGRGVLTALLYLSGVGCCICAFLLIWACSSELSARLLHSFLTISAIYSSRCFLLCTASASIWLFSVFSLRWCISLMVIWLCACASINLKTQSLSFLSAWLSMTILKIVTDLLYLSVMNPDYYSEVKLAERFFFENSIYLLGMFEKKVDSFISNKTRQARQRERTELMHHLNIINFDNKTEDPAKALAKDLTKPIWNCVTKSDPVVVSLENSTKIDGPPLLTATNDLFHRFLLRMKHEHEDQSNFRLALLQIPPNSHFQDFANREGDERYWPRLQELMAVLGRVREKYERDLRERNEQNQFMEAYLNWARLMLQEVTVHQGRQLLGQEARIPAELYRFVSVACRHMQDVIESAQGPTVINYWPQLHYLPDLVHPMLMPIYVIIRAQLMDDRRRQNSSSSMHGSSSNIEEESGYVFEEMPQRNFSKISFINFDGYDSPFNLTVAKSLSKFLQYISFPCDEGEALQQQSYSHYFNNYSQLLVKHYVLAELNEQEKALQHRLFRTKSRTDRQLGEYYKQLLVFPVYSRYLSQKYDMRSVQFYQSKFIKFVMKELVYIHLKEFNPSIIVISMSHRLHLDTPFFEELIKELTIIGNMRIVFYNNFTRNYMFHSPLPARYQPVQQAYECHRLYTERFDGRIGLIRDNQVNLSVLHRTATFLKIASGTYTLQRTSEEDNLTQKYDIFRVQRYAGTLIKLIGRGHPILQRFKNRCNEYLRLQRMLSSIYESDKLIEDTHNNLPLFHKALLQFTHKMIEDIVKGEANSHKFMKRVSREQVDAEWQDFALRFGLEIKRQREEEDYKYITRLKRVAQNKEAPKGEFIALQFQIVNNGVIHLVLISKHSQICMQHNRQATVPLVYLFNHLLDQRSSQLRSYCGEVEPSLEQSFEKKVVLTEIELPWQPQHPFQSLTKFNYLETAAVVLLFWPSLYDHSLALASRFLHQQYDPAITNLIFAADRRAPHRFIQVTPANSSYSDIIPRCGCTCYQIPETNLVYIFGGFYSNQQNYLNFQTDITVARIGQQLQVSNVPKNFYFDYEQTNPHQADLPFKMVGLKQDFVRPRIQFEVYQLERGEDIQNMKILLLGGVGQKFVRPFSMIGYMAHHLTFSKEGSLKTLRRIRLNNLVPVNLHRPVKERVPVQANVVYGAQNRQIYLRKSSLPAGSAVFNWYDLTYDKQDKMGYFQGDSLAVLPEPRQDRPQNTLVIRQNNILVTAKASLRHFSSLKEVDNKLALVYQYGGPVEQSGSVIFSLQLQLAQEVYLRFVNLPSRQVPLTGTYLVAIDTLGLQLFAVLRHEEYTNGRWVLAHCDIAGSVQGLVDGNDRRIILRQVYRFDGDMHHCTVKALPDRRLALLHGFPMHIPATLPQCILKRTVHGHYVREEVLNDFPTYSLNAFLNQQLYHSAPISFFFVSRQSVMSWSFRSASRGTGEEEYHFLVEQLSCREQVKRWRLKTHKTVRFQKMFVTSQEAVACVTTILDIRVTGQKKHEILLMEGGRIFIGNFDGHLQSSSNTVTLREYDRPIQQYEIQKFRHKFNVDYLQKLTKYPSRYQEAQQEMEAEKLQ